MSRARLGVAGAVLALTAAAPGSAAGAPSLLTGFTDIDAYQGNDGALRKAALANTRTARASVVRVIITWSEIAPRRPPNAAAASDPAWPGYEWAGLDAVVRDIADTGLLPLLNFYRAPRWAEGRGRPPVTDRAPGGSWRPSTKAYRHFSRAAARRYSGRFPDPARPGRFLPWVRHWQAWNEPNLSEYLAPQWARRRGRIVPASPGRYRALLNGFYRGIKSVSPRNRVISGGTAPFGEPWRGGLRMPPALFTRAWLCVGAPPRLRPIRCSGSPSRFDALAHHPFAVHSPLQYTDNRDDVKMADIENKLIRPLRAAIRAGKVRPRRGVQIWATEFSWDSSPPDPDGVPIERHAQYVQGGLYTLWRQGVDVAVNYQFRDGAMGRGWEFSYQSGVFFRGSSVADDGAKPALSAYRFPFTAYRRRGVARLWGLAPGGGMVRIEAQRGERWKLLTRLRAGRNRVFFGRRRVGRGTLLRARMGPETSLGFRVGPSETLCAVTWRPPPTWAPPGCR